MYNLPNKEKSKPLPQFKVPNTPRGHFWDFKGHLKSQFLYVVFLSQSTPHHLSNKKLASYPYFSTKTNASKLVQRKRSSAPPPYVVFLIHFIRFKVRGKNEPELHKEPNIVNYFKLK